MLITFISFIFIGTLELTAIITADVPVVSTKYGDLIGFYDKETNGKTFLGIPYAKPPLGDLRFRPPQVPNSWSPQVRIADTHAPSCIQTNNSTISSEAETIENQSEDCLYLNIFSPDREAKDNSLLPVLVWIHGGSFKAGSSRKAYFYGNRLSNHGKIIVVSFNYRLGLLGFLTLEELNKEDSSFPTSGNYGLLDQNFALKWVNENIKAFGGDPNNITLGGASAGAISVCFHLLMPISKGLFHKTIMESASCATPEYEKQEQRPTVAIPSLKGQIWQQIGLKFMSDLKCANVACLRNLPANAIRNYQTESVFDFVVYPVIDGNTIPDDPLKLFANGNFHKVDTIFGTTTDESTIFTNVVPLREISETEYKGIISYLSPQNATEIMPYYSIKNYISPRKAILEFLTDFGALCIGRQMLRYIQAQGKQVFEYQFNYAPSYLSDFEKNFFGAYHIVEMNFVFNQTGDNIISHKPFNFTDNEKSLSLNVQNFWTSFIKSQNPSSSAISWKSYTNTNLPYLFLDQNIIEMRNNFKMSNCDFYDSFVPMKKINVNIPAAAKTISFNYSQIVLYLFLAIIIIKF